jgi:hypothetical protein
MRDPREILDRYLWRRTHSSKWRQGAETVRRVYNYEEVVPLPEMDALEKPAIANLLATGIDQNSMRIASQMPTIEYPPLRPGITKSEDLARQRMLANLAWWDMNDMQQLLRQRARFLLAYGQSLVVVRPISPKLSDKRQIPFWRVYNPLDCYLPKPQYLGDHEPEDTIICHRQSFGWLQNRYPDAARRINKHPGADASYEILEYLDHEDIVLMAVGAPHDVPDATPRGFTINQSTRGSPYEVLEAQANRIGLCPAVNAMRITLDRTMGMFESLPPMYKKQAALDALEYISIKRGIFPEEWAVTHPTSPTSVRIVTPADAQRGTIGEIQGGQIQTVPIQPGAQTPQAIDRIERNQRVTSGIPAEWGGESPTNIRTARRGADVIASTVDMPIGEAQDIFARSLEAENIRAIATMKEFHGNKATSFYVGRTDPEPPRKDYTPKIAFGETDWHVVKYSMPGSDAASIPIELGQRIGTQEMSLQTAREIDPIIDDPIRERNQVELEALRRSMLSGIEQRSAAGMFDPLNIAKIAAMKAENPGMFIEDAMIEVDKMLAAQQAQAAQAQQQQPGAGGPGGPMLGAGGPPTAGPPGAGPGGLGAGPPSALAAAGNAEGNPALPQPPGQAVNPPPGSALHLQQILTSLRRGAAQSPAERQLTAPGGT